MPSHLAPHPTVPGIVWDANAGFYRPTPQPSYVTNAAQLAQWEATPEGAASVAAAKAYGVTFAEQEASRVRLAQLADVPYQQQSYPGQNQERSYSAYLASLPPDESPVQNTPTEIAQMAGGSSSTVPATTSGLLANLQIHAAGTTAAPQGENMALVVRVQLPNADQTPGGTIETVTLPENGPTATLEGFKAAVEPYGYRVLEVVGTAQGASLDVISSDQLLRQGFLGGNQTLSPDVNSASSCPMGVCGPVGINLPGDTPGTIPVNDSSGSSFQFKGGGSGGLLSSLFPGFGGGGGGGQVPSLPSLPANNDVRTLGYNWWTFVKGPFGILAGVLVLILVFLRHGKGAVKTV